MANTGRPLGKTDTVKRKSRRDADADRIQPLKDEYLAFYRRFPVQAAAADFIGRSVDTIQEWRKHDPWFAEEVQKAKASWATKNFLRVRPDNLLMNLYPELRPPKQEIEHSGEAVGNTVIYLPANGRDPEPTPNTTTDPD